jgi:hypothetical protein
MLAARKKLIRRRAMAAAVFAGAIVSLQNLVMSKDDAGLAANGALVQQIASDTEITHEVRAYHLLQLADHYLSDKTRALAEQLFKSDGTKRPRGWRLEVFRMDDQLTKWAEKLSAERSRLAEQNIQSYKLALAAAAAKEAVIQLKLSSNEFAKLNLYYIASMLLAKMGEKEESQKCSDVLECAFLLCEHDSHAEEKRVKAVTSVLNLKAYGILPVVIPLEQSARDQDLYSKPFSDKDFKFAEQLRLRAVAIADRLNDASDIRRKEHRDMFFWYAQLGKAKLAETQKQSLFDLVGRHDDRVLYPYRGICGMYVWWQEPSADSLRLLCGMG